MRRCGATFPGHDPSDILAILDQYGAEGHETGRERVQLAILKLSDGDEEKLRDFLQIAKQDYRDVLYWSEYPGQAKRGYVNPAELDDEVRRELREIIEHDWQQYQRWLQGTDEPNTIDHIDQH